MIPLRSERLRARRVSFTDSKRQYFAVNPTNR
jgi:hypothetical protein